MTRDREGIRWLARGAAAVLLLAAPVAHAEWHVSAESLFYYTDDAALFSATRRTLKDEDPTQPILDFDLAQQGSDFVYEPVLEIGNTFALFGEDATVRVRAQGFVFGVNPRYNHASLAVEAGRPFGSRFQAFARYFFVPDLFLGDNEVRSPEGDEGEEEPPLAAEQLDSHFWALGLRYQVTNRIAGTLFGRGGIRRYDQPFQQRDTDFYTAALHVEFDLGERADLTVGFHYERGLADGRNGIERRLRDDISYRNYFLTHEVEVELTPRLDLELALHLERTDFTTNIPEDERNGEHENQVQGDIQLVYELTDAVDLTAGFQGAYRKESFEDSLRNLNAWLGVRASF